MYLARVLAIFAITLEFQNSHSVLGSNVAQIEIINMVLDLESNDGFYVCANIISESIQNPSFLRTLQNPL